MNVSKIPVNPAPTPAVTPLDNKRAALQGLLLKKSLELHQQQANELAQPLTGKGRLLDIRV